MLEYYLTTSQVENHLNCFAFLSLGTNKLSLETHSKQVKNIIIDAIPHHMTPLILMSSSLMGLWCSG